MAEGEAGRMTGKAARDTVAVVAKRGKRLGGTVLLVVVLLLGASPRTAALTVRGHAFAFALGAGGEGRIADPGGVAVSDATGEVYVLDRADDRVVQYAREVDARGRVTGYRFLAAWGWGVAGGGRAYEVCTSGCGAGVEHKGFELSGAQAIAVDNCTHGGRPCSSAEDPSVGDVYVLAPREHEGEAYEALEKFTPDGKPVERATRLSYEEGGERERLEELEAVETHGLTVAPDGTPWLYYEEELYPLSDQGLRKGVGGAPLAVLLSGQPASGLAVDGRGGFYVAQELDAGGRQARTVVSKWTLAADGGSEAELEEVSEALEGEDTTGLAVDAGRGEVYLGSVSSVVEVGLEGSLVQRFGDEVREGRPVLEDGAGVAVNAATREVFVSDAAAGRVDVFGPEEPVAPTVEGVSAQDVSADGAQLDASIDPEGASEPTAYRFEYWSAPCGADGCATVPGGVLGGAAFGDEGFGEQAVSVRVGEGTAAPLAPGTTYHFRVVAENEYGRTVSGEGGFSTPPAECACVADGRVWEMVSPPEKGGALIEALTFEGGTIQAAGTGDALAYVATAPIGAAEGSRSFEPTQMLATRGAQGWESGDIVTPTEHGIGVAVGTGSEYRLFSQDLALSVVQPLFGLGRMAEPALAPPVSEQERALAARGGNYQENTVYVRADSPLAPEAEAEQALYRQALGNGASLGNPGYVALVDGANVLPGGEFGPNGSEALISFIDATPDLSHVVLDSKVMGPAGCTAGMLGCTPGLYEWSAGQLQLVNRIGGAEGEIVETTGLGTRSEDVRNAISSDGSRVFWEANKHLYMRDMAKTPEPETIQIDEAQESRPVLGDAEFQIANVEGSRVFFSDTRPLTAQSGEEGTADLYVCEITENPASGRLECELSDLTPEQGGESAQLQGTANNERGGVLGASEDGSYVYFVANGVLSRCQSDTGQQVACKNPEGEEPAPGHCGQAGYREARCNLYLDHYGGEPGNPGWPAHPTFIARLSEADEPDWQGLSADAAFTSRVSPNGRFLAFMSERELTGYDNVDSSPQAHGARDEEVYEYAAAAAGREAGRLVCASCDPTGARPAGVFDPREGENGAEGVGLLVDRPQSWAGRWLAGNIPGWTRLAHHGAEPFALYQSRYLSDAGRLFFNSPEALVAQDHNGKEDVYEYEPRGVPQGPHACTAAAATYSARAQGCVGLVSSGTSERESAFLDASETGGEGPGGEELSEGGGDVFFVTGAALAPQDTDTEFDIYDAHECTRAQPCRIAPEEAPPAVCASIEVCRPYTPLASLGAPASAGPAAAGNLAARHNVLSNGPAGKPKPLTRAEKLARSLRDCASRYRHADGERARCERQARSSYAKPKVKLAAALTSCRKHSHGARRSACERAARTRYHARVTGKAQGSAGAMR